MSCHHTAGTRHECGLPPRPQDQPRQAPNSSLIAAQSIWQLDAENHHTSFLQTAAPRNDITHPKTSGKAFKSPPQLSNHSTSHGAESWSLYPAFERDRPRGEPGPSARRNLSRTGMRPGRSGKDQPVTEQCSQV